MSLSETSVSNEKSRPIIGILSYDIDFAIRDQYQFDKKYQFYISAGFVKWIESAGAEVIPIWADRTDEYYRQIMKKINGVLFPGGQFWFNDKENGKAAYSARKIYDIAREINDKGEYFPIWGTTLGFQLLFYAASGGQTDCRTEIKLYKGNFSFNFTNDFGESRLFGNAKPNILEVLRSQPCGSYHSIYGVTEEILRNLNLVNEWHILSTATNDGIKFITSAEHKKYPFFGILCRPQRCQFETSVLANRDSVEISQYFANFIVEQAQQNKNSMSNTDRLCHSINNFGITFVEPRVPKFRQVYLFENDTVYPTEPRSDIRI